MAMRLYHKSEFHDELGSRLRLKPTGRQSDTQELWVSLDDPKKFALVPILKDGERVPDYVFDFIVTNYGQSCTIVDPMLEKNFELREKTTGEVVPFSTKKVAEE